MNTASDSKQFFAELAQETTDGVLHTSVHAESEEYRGVDAQEMHDERDGQLAIDVYQTATAIIVEAPIAGVQSDDIDIHITSESLMIRGRRHRDHTIKERDYLFQECYWGRFSRSVILPEEINADKAEATIKNGVLRVTMPKLSHYHGKRVGVTEA